MLDNFQSIFAGNIKDIPLYLLIIIYIWSFIWKGIALWKSSQNSQKYWFVTLLLLNSIGIVEIIYLSFFQKKLKIKIIKD